MYVIIETADVEIISVRLVRDRAEALRIFEMCCLENECEPSEDLENEVKGTIAIGGDDGYAVQVVRPFIVDAELAQDGE